MTKLWLILVLAAVVLWYFQRSKARPAMPRDEAARLLGIARDADANAIADAHRRLIAKVHPDVGGNAELAARINLARDTMLKR